MTLRVSGLTAVRSGRRILFPTDLEFSPGERVALVGASGSGKSTLGHVLADRLQTERVPVAHVAQSPDEALDPLRSMDFHWRQAERALHLDHDPEKQSELFSALHIEGADLRARPWGWSRGMQQRFCIAMALLSQPTLLILDEPTSALDPIVAATTMTLLDRHLSGTSITMLLITHDLGLAARRVDRLIVMSDGRVAEDAPTQRLLAQPQSESARALVAHRNWALLPC